MPRLGNEDSGSAADVQKLGAWSSLMSKVDHPLVIMAVVIRRRVKVVTVSVGAEKLMHPYPHVTGIPEKTSAAQATASLAAPSLSM